MYQSIYLSLDLSTYLPIFLLTYLSVSLPVCLPIYKLPEIFPHDPTGSGIPDAVSTAVA